MLYFLSFTSSCMFLILCCYHITKLSRVSLLFFSSCKKIKYIIVRYHNVHITHFRNTLYVKVINFEIRFPCTMKLGFFLLHSLSNIFCTRLLYLIWNNFLITVLEQKTESFHLITCFVVSFNVPLLCFFFTLKSWTSSRTVIFGFRTEGCIFSTLPSLQIYLQLYC